MSAGTSPDGECAPRADAPSQRQLRFGKGPTALVLWGLSVVLLGASIWVLQTLPVRASLLRLQWAGSASVANTIVREVPGPYRAALNRDLLLLIPLYTVGLVTAGYLGWRVFWTRRLQVAARVGIVAAITAALCNYAQDAVLLGVLGHQPMQGVWPFRAAAALSFVKFSALVVAVGIGLIALGTTIGRRVQHGTTKTAGTEP